MSDSEDESDISELNSVEDSMSTKSGKSSVSEPESESDSVVVW